jgi:hypothetical protein
MTKNTKPKLSTSTSLETNSALLAKVAISAILFASLFTATCFIEGRVFCFGYVVNTGHDGHGFR